jgi:anti-sigma regulatory factor (Ser/Thr protein kinase)
MSITAFADELNPDAQNNEPPAENPTSVETPAPIEVAVAPKEEYNSAASAATLQEAVNNAILHGNMMESSKLVTLIAEKTKDLLKVTVMDEGSGFDYSKIPDPTLPDAMFDFSGRGLYVMKTLSDQLIFENNGASVALLFML